MEGQIGPFSFSLAIGLEERKLWIQTALFRLKLTLCHILSESA